MPVLATSKVLYHNYENITMSFDYVKSLIYDLDFRNDGELGFGLVIMTKPFLLA